MEEKTKESVRALEKALTIMDVIKESNRPLGVNEISKQCSINVTTTFRILKTLKSRGWVHQDENDKYIIGHKVSFVTDKNNFYLSLKEIAYYTMTRLSAMVLQAMNLIIRDNEKCLILQQSRTDKIVDYVPPIGTVLPIYASAGGKILLSELPDFLREEILNITELKPLTKYTITRRGDLLEELVKVKQLGYAVDARESQEEGFCIAVPVRSKDGEIIAALSFSGFIGKMSENEINYYLQILIKASAEITENLFQYQ
ncbi:MAG TPA: IclR family transcriptional regulator [Armatimonadota bacterium]|nr:IclR family transcriptional regulator [Armatimonadota bacterium]